MYPAFLRESLSYSATDAGTILSLFGIGALASIPGGWVGDRFPPRLVLTLTFFVTAVLGYLLFNGSGAFIPQAILSFAWGVVTSGLLYVNLAAYHVKALRSDLAGRGSGMFVSSFYLSSAFAEYVMGWLVTRSGWGFAGSVQISLLERACTTELTAAEKRS